MAPDSQSLGEREASPALLTLHEPWTAAMFHVELRTTRGRQEDCEPGERARLHHGEEYVDIATRRPARCVLASVNNRYN